MFKGTVKAETVRKGFTLIELMIVVCILAIITSVAIPSLLHSRKSAQEASAISALRSLATAEQAYKVRFKTYGNIVDLTNASILDDSWVGFHRSGYVFTSAVAPDGQVWAAVADPETPGVSGDRYFYVDDTGVIRSKEGAPATVADPALDG